MIGERLKEVRKDHHDTQADLAEQLKISIFTVQSWEQEKSEPSHEMLTSICRLYDVSSDFLLGLRNDDPMFYRNEESLEPVLHQDDQRVIKMLTDYLIRKNKSIENQ